MANKVIEFVKAHPYGVAAGVFGVGIVYLVLRNNSASSNSGTVINGTSASDVQAATQLQLDLAQLQQQDNQVQAAANVQSQQTAAQVTVAGLQAQTQQNADTVAANSADTIAQLQAQTQQVIGTLQAQVADTSTNANLQSSLAQTQALQNIALAPYEVQLAALNNNSSIAVQDYNTLQDSVNAALWTVSQANSNGQFDPTSTAAQQQLIQGLTSLGVNPSAPPPALNAAVPGSH